MIRCPTDDELVRFVDGALSLEETDRLRGHLARCPGCREAEAALRAIVQDVRGAVSSEFDGRAHARAVMERLDGPAAAEPKPRRASWFAGAAAACVLLAAAYGAMRAPSARSAWQSRGGSAPAAIGRDVGVQPYAVEGGLRPLVSGSTIDATTPLTAGFRNLGETPAFLLLFAVDAQSVVHWISPAYTRSDDDPPSTRLSASTREQMIGATVVFDDVRSGPLRLIAVITSAPAHVSDVESLAGTDLSAARLTRRLPGAEVRETTVDVHDSLGGTR